ncbi:MAG: hypothetical protein WB402_00220 [Sulfuricaulis sp.]|uniref:hypothetical protein n=1 Tax=Sulfuricaulis sp. TaxID=2003553 RepID=UPI003C4E9806
MKRFFSSFIIKISACLWLLLGASNLANASTVPVFEYVDTIIGPAAGESTSFTIAAPGSYIATITDLTFFPGSSFGTVALGISTSLHLFGSTALVSPSANDSASFPFTATPGKYFSNVVGTCTGLCSYGVEITAVPLPPAILLFGSGIFGLMLISRRK